MRQHPRGVFTWKLDIRTFYKKGKSSRINLVFLNLETIFVFSLGSFPTHKGYKCCHPPSKKIIATMDVTFFETCLIFPFIKILPIRAGFESFSQTKLRCHYKQLKLKISPMHSAEHMWPPQKDVEKKFWLILGLKKGKTCTFCQHSEYAFSLILCN